MAIDRAAYQRSYRQSHEDYQKRVKQLENARRAARIRLAELHPKQYEKLLAEEKRERGIT